MMGSEPDNGENDLLESVKLDKPDEPADEFSLVHSPPPPLSSHPLGVPDELDLEFDDGEDDQDLYSSSRNHRISSTSGNNHSVHTGASSSSDEIYLNVVVSQPKKEVDSSGTSIIPGGSNFVTYLITTRTNIPEYNGIEFDVRRRFRDIVALADTLVDKYRGYFVPSRPDKNTVERQIMDKHNFIDQRRFAIEKYLRRLCAHPVLRRSEELKTFLVSKGKLPMVPSMDVASRMLDGAAKLPRQLFGDGVTPLNPREVVHSAKGGRDLLRLFKELKQSVTNDWVAKPSVVEEDKEFLEKREALREYERRLSQAAFQADSMVKAQASLSGVVGDLGLSFFKLANLETLNSGDPAYAKNVKRMAVTTVKSSRHLKAAAVVADRHLGHLHEHLAVLQSANSAFVDRNGALLTVQTLLSDIALMHSKAEKHNAASLKVFGGDRNRNKKVDDLKESIKVTQEACENAQQQYNHIKEHNRVELERIEAEKQTNFMSMLQEFACSQVVAAEKLSKEWTQVVEAGHSNKRLDSPMFRSSLPFHG